MSEEKGTCTTIFGEEAEIPLGETAVQKSGRRKEARNVEGASAAHLKSHHDLMDGTAKCKRCFDKSVIFSVTTEPYTRLVLNPCHECNNRDEVVRLLLVCAEVTKRQLNPQNPYPQWKTLPIPDRIREAMQEFFDDCKAPSAKTLVSQLEIETVEKDFALHHPFKEKDADKWSYPHIISRNAVFRVASTKERAKYQKAKIVAGRMVNYDAAYPYEPREGWHGEIIVQTGPLLDTYDERVFLALLKIHHQTSGFSGDKMSTSLREIARLMGIKWNSSNGNSIKSSLDRLSSTTLRIIMPKGMTWSENLISGGYEDSSERVVMRFNSHMLVHYKRHAYSIFSLPEDISLSGYAQRIYVFLCSHQDAEKEISLKRWREILDVAEDFPAKKFNAVMRNALTELAEKNLLKKESKIVDNRLRSILNRQVIPLPSK